MQSPKFKHEGWSYVFCQIASNLEMLKLTQIKHFMQFAPNLIFILNPGLMGIYYVKTLFAQCGPEADGLPPLSLVLLKVSSC